MSFKGLLKLNFEMNIKIDVKVMVLINNLKQIILLHFANTEKRESHRRIIRTTIQSEYVNISEMFVKIQQFPTILFIVIFGFLVCLLSEHVNLQFFLFNFFLLCQRPVTYVQVIIIVTILNFFFIFCDLIRYSCCIYVAIQMHPRSSTKKTTKTHQSLCTDNRTCRCSRSVVTTE